MSAIVEKIQTTMSGSQHPKQYKAAQISEKGGKFELVSKDWQEPKEGQVVAKVLACGVCFSDSAVVHQHMPTGLPRVPGHEIIGDVVAVGPGEKTWKVGDRVGSGWHGGHCFTCASCRSGDFVTCQNENINGILTDGGYAEYILLRSEAVARIPKELDPAEAAPLLCAGVTTFNSLRHMDIEPGDVVAVQGIGGLGSLAIQFAAKSGFHTVALSSSGSKEEYAKGLGAADYVDGSKTDHAEYLQKLGGAKVVMCTAPNPEVIPSLINSLSPSGQLLLLAVVPELKVPAMPMIQKRLSLRGWPSGTAKDSEDTVKFAQLAGVSVQVTKFPLDKVQEAFDHMASGKVRGRAVLVP